MGNTNNPYADHYGFRVIEVKPGSPAEKSGLQVSSDFIVTINGKHLNDLETSEITRLVAENENKVLNLLVWSSISESSREVSLTPSRKWPGEGLLGVIIRYDRYDADKKSSEQNMAFDQLYDAETGTTQYRNDRLNPRAGPGPSGPTPEKQSSFFGSLPGLGLSRKTSTENPARNIDLDHEFSFDKIYGGETFQEASPMQQQKPGRAKPAPPTTPPPDEFTGSNSLAKKKSTPAIDAHSPVKEGDSELSPKKRKSLTSTLSSSVFSWASPSEKEK